MNAAIHVAGWTLVHFAWQGAAGGRGRGSRACGCCVTRRRSRATRVACLALAAMLALPGATAWRLLAAPLDVEPAAPVRRNVFLPCHAGAAGPSTVG